MTSGDGTMILSAAASERPAAFSFPYHQQGSLLYGETGSDKLEPWLQRQCQENTDRTGLLFIDVPTAFTPNNDGLNDYFRPHNALKADNYQFKVYNRWGQLIFQSANWREKWDGKINGVLQPTAVYVWMLSYIHRDTKQPVFKKGTVTLIR